MKQFKLMPVLALILVFAISVPASATMILRDNYQPVDRMPDHPWGGEAFPTHDLPDYSGAPVGFIDLPFIYIDIYNVIIIGDFRSVNDSNQEDRQNDEILPENYNNTNYNNQDSPTRGN